MRISDDGISLIKKWETLRLQAYLDAPSTRIWTIGYGHTDGVNPNDFITEAQADLFLKEDLKISEDSVNYYTENLGLNQNQFDALVSLVFNVGAGTIFTKVYNNGFSYGSTLYNNLLEKDFSSASTHFIDFIYAGGKYLRGLKLRRLDEEKLFKKKIIVQFC